jgi:serine/threonine protein kinase
MGKVMCDFLAHCTLLHIKHACCCRYIGGGAFGEVYLCKWHGTDVAIKCLSPSLLASNSSSSSSKSAAGAAAELLQEAATMAAMRHPHVMSAIGVVLPPSGIISLTGVVIDDAGDAAGAESAGPGGIRPGDYVQGPAVVCEYLSAGSLQGCINSGAEWLKSGMAKVKVMLDTARVSSDESACCLQSSVNVCTAVASLCTLYSTCSAS